MRPVLLAPPAGQYRPLPQQGRYHPSDPEHPLGRILIHAIHRYRARYPAVTTDSVIDALEQILALMHAIRAEEIQN